MASVLTMLRSASMVSIGTLLGQLIAFAGSLILVRIYTPDQMGVFTTVVAVASFISPLASGRLSNAIPLPLRHLSAVTIFKIGVFASILVSALICVLLLCFNLATDEGERLEPAWWWGIPVLIVSLVIYSGMNGLAVRFEKYFGLALRGVMYPLVMTGAQILLGLAHFGSEGLILGMALGHVFTALTIWIPVRVAVRNETAPSSNWKKLLSEYRHFPLVLGPAGAINGLAMQLPQIGITALFGLTIGGQFGMMMKILAVPVALIGQSVGFVYAGQIAKSRRAGEGDVKYLFDKMSTLLGGIALAFAMFAFFLAEPVFAWLLGEEWRMSGEFAALFALATAMQLVASPLSQTLVVSERTGQQFSIDAIRAGTLALAFGALFYLQTEEHVAVLVIGLVSMAGYSLLWLVNRRASKDIRPSLQAKQSTENDIEGN